MLKTNINKLDFELNLLFNQVTIKEGQDKSEYFFDILVEKKHEDKIVAVRLFISKPQLEQAGTVKWRYLSDTRDADSFLVERYSDLNVLASDIHSVVVEKKLDGGYLESLVTVDEELVVEQIKTELTPLARLLEKFDVCHLETHTKIDDSVIMELGHFRHSLRESDRVRTELALQAAGYQDMMWTADRLFVKYYV